MNDKTPKTTLEVDWLDLIQIKHAIEERNKKTWDSNASEYVKECSDGHTEDLCKRIEAAFQRLREHGR